MYSYGINCHNTKLPQVQVGYLNKTLKWHELVSTSENISNNWRPSGFLRKNEYVSEQMGKYVETEINHLMSESQIGDAAANLKSKMAKNLIDRYSRNHLWDKTKILTNPYEFIYFTSRKYLPLGIHPIADLEPLSRSFFKMIEMANTGLHSQINNPSPLTTLHLAEGPGGFIEALIYMRQQAMYKRRLQIDIQQAVLGESELLPKDQCDRFYGITLLDERSYEVPSWKKSQQFISANPQLQILTGVDSKGNLYNTATLRALCHQFSVPDRYGKIRRPSIITGDGGFDFSVNHGLQEYNAARLILAQVIAAMLTLERSPRSVFICKFFDIHLQLTMEILYMLQCRFQKVYIFKPYTSRMANSEKYIICQGYLGPCDDTQTSETIDNYDIGTNSIEDSGRLRIHAMQPFLDILDAWNDVEEDNTVAISTVTRQFKRRIANTRDINSTNTDASVPNADQNSMAMSDINLTNIGHIFPEGTMPQGFVDFISRINGEIVDKQKENILYTIEIIEGKKQLPENWCEHMIDTAVKWCQQNNIPIDKKYRTRI